MSNPSEKPPRRFPPPCWTQDETLALIDAYRDRWFALRRGYLRTADWDAVAAVVTRRYPDVSPSKTSAQCRHKMEKLRQRYRVEKQRSLSFPGQFFSSWFFFNNMSSMDNGPSAALGSNQKDDNRVESGGGLRIKSLGDRNLVESVFGTRNCEKIDGNSNPNLDLDQDGVDPGDGFRVKALGNRNSFTSGFRAKNCVKVDGNSSSNLGSRVLNGCLTNLDAGSDEDTDHKTDFGVKDPADGKFVLPLFRGKKFHNIHGNFGHNFDTNHDEVGDCVDDGDGYCFKTPIDQDFLPPQFREKKFGKLDGNSNPNFDYTDSRFCVKLSGERYSVPAGFRAKKTDGKGDLNGFSSTTMGAGLGKKSGDRGIKRERGQIEEMVSSIKLLGEGFVKTENLKMEMTREIEKMRMEMEMKRNELILESQRQILDTFVTLFRENKKEKANTTTS
ncbi:hypothetical protein U1Q18_021451 [Sarracenia purpurea var. burkii]